MTAIAAEIMVPIENLHYNPNNPRREAGDVTELAASLQEFGLLQPLVVSPAAIFGQGHYFIEAGSRRWTAARHVGLRELPCRVRASQPDEGKTPTLLIALIENVQREDLTAMEKAWAYGQLLEELGTQGEVARRTGVSGTTVSRYLTLLELDNKSQDRVRTGKVKVDEAIAAVQNTRAKQRKKEGKQPVSIGWEPEYFTHTHPLASKAQVMCDARKHTSRRRLGAVACGQCWETVIRHDQDIVRGVVTASLSVPFIPPERASIQPERSIASVRVAPRIPFDVGTSSNGASDQLGI